MTRLLIVLAMLTATACAEVTPRHQGPKQTAAYGICRPMIPGISCAQRPQHCHCEAPR